MASTRTQLLLAAATFLTGMLAGGVVDRVVVGGPAWQELGPKPGRNTAASRTSAPALSPIPSKASARRCSRWPQRSATMSKNVARAAQ